MWEIRFRDHTPGNPARPRYRIGTLAEYPTKAAASRAAQPLRDQFNKVPDALLIHRRTFGDLLDRYVEEELPPRHSTSRNYLKMIRVHIRPRWDKTPIADVRAQDVRTWLRALTVTGRTGETKQMSSKYRGHIHGMMRRIFRFAMLWEWIPIAANPMSLFSLEGASKRTRQPGILSLTQFHQILDLCPDERYRVMFVGAMSLGLRVSELLALKWQDFDFAGNIVHIERAIVEGHVDDVKTIHSKKPLPLDALLASAFEGWRAASLFNDPEDWVFPTSTGENPYAASSVQSRILIPIGKAMGLAFSLGWHTFRHSYKAWMDQGNVPLTVQRDLMRHADIRTTMQVYGEVRLEELREANTNVVNRVIRVN